MMSGKNRLWITDPFEKLAPHLTDTTLRLIEASLDRGDENALVDFHTLKLEGGKVFGNVQKCSIESKTRVGVGAASLADLSSWDEIHYRVDPPVDLRYWHPLQILVQGLGEKNSNKLVNPAETLFMINEKMISCSFPGSSPRSVVSSDWNTLFEFGKSQGQTVLKPLNGYQSQGIELLKWNDSIAHKMSHTAISKITEDFTRPCQLQEYLPEIQKGELRLWWVDGQAIAAVRKFPLAGGFKVNIDAGSRLEKASSDDVPEPTRKSISAFLKKHRIRYAAIDFIGTKISDFNITSPGLLVEMEIALGKDLAAMCF